MTIRIPDDIAAKLIALESSASKDWMHLLRLVGEDPTTFFKAGNWSHCDFSHSDVSSASFEGAVIDGSRFRMGNLSQDQIASAHSAQELEFVAPPSTMRSGEASRQAGIEALVAHTRSLTAWLRRSLSVVSNVGGWTLGGRIALGAALATVLLILGYQLGNWRNSTDPGGSLTAEEDPAGGVGEYLDRYDSEVVLTSSETIDTDRLLASAEQGNAASQAVLGHAYRFGMGVPKDLAQAVRWLRSAADQGHAEALAELSGMYRDGDGVLQDAAEADRLLRLSVEQGQDFQANKLAADQGDPVAQFNIGVSYEKGGDLARASQWYRKAADQGDARALETLGYMYRFGHGVQTDEVEALKLLRLSVERSKYYEENLSAAESGAADVQYEIGRLYDGVDLHTDASRWYFKAAEGGNASAQSILGHRYRSGLGVPKDENEALKWLQRSIAQHPDYEAISSAAESGLAWGQFLLGALYDEGGDAVVAAQWYRLAADQGDAEAQERLGRMYLLGIGVPQSEDDAEKYFKLSVEHGNDYARTRLAAIRGDDKAQLELGRTYSSGGAETEATRWYRLAADQANTDAQYLLGRAYRFGNGVAEDPVEAAKWFEIGATLGDETSQRELGKIVLAMTPEQVATAHKYALEWLAAHSAGATGQ